LAVRIGSLIPDLSGPTPITLPDGETLLLEPVLRKGRRLMLPDFDPCVVLLNNDLSAGVPELLRGLDQDVVPPLHAGWTTRRKSRHFAAYDQVAAEFAQLIDIDPWTINPYFGVCDRVDFQSNTGEECLAAQVDLLLARIGEKYRECGISERPFVIVKADAGTYGMGIMTVRDAAEVKGLNRKQRNKMAVVKEGLEVNQVIIQEGVYTFETVNEAIAEPVVYMIDRYVVGGFYRVHTARGKDENLNAPGMQFEPLAFAAPCQPDPAGPPGCPPNRFYAYGVVARLAMLAAAREIEEMAEQAQEAVAA
jgi:glutamate--cysteine ligase